MEYDAACIPCLMSLPTSALTLLNIRISYGCCLCVKSEKVNLRQICAKKRPAVWSALPFVHSLAVHFPEI